ncbi:oRF617 protein [Firmicutes bacterium CAG:475]|nr:oRF617 protein [Firmicutes bacterium CAG:475]
MLCEQHKFSDRYAFEEEKFDYALARLCVLIYRAEFERLFFKLLFGERRHVYFDNVAEVCHRIKSALVVDGQTARRQSVLTERCKIFLCGGKCLLRHKSHLTILVCHNHAVAIRNRFRLAGCGIILFALFTAHDDRHTLGVESFLYCKQFVFDDCELSALGCQNRFEQRNLFFEICKFLFELAHFEFGKALQAHIQNRLRLSVAQIESLTQSFFCLCRGFRLFDYLDNFVDIADCHKQTSHDFRSCFCGFQIVGGAIDDYSALIFDVVVEIRRKRQLFGLTVCDCNHIDGIAHFEIALLKEEGNDFVDVRVFFALDDRARTRLVALVNDFGNALQSVLVGFFEVGNARKQFRLGNLIRNFGDYDVLFTVVVVFDMQT